MDLEMFTQLRLQHPGVTVDTEVVEPSAQQLHNYRGELLFTTKKKKLSVIIFSLLELNSNKNKNLVITQQTSTLACAHRYVFFSQISPLARA